MFYNMRGNTVPAPSLPKTTKDRAPGVATPALWTPSRSTATLLRCMSKELDLGWKLNRSTQPDILVLTNLGRSNPERLAARCRPLGVILCLDDRAGREFQANTKLPCFTYSEGRDEADLTAHALRTTSDGLSFVVVTREELAQVATPTNALYTALTALACAVAVGVPLSDAAATVTELLCGSDKTA